MANRITLNHPLLEELRRADREAAEAFPHGSYDPGLGGIGLLFHNDLTPNCYDCTPHNAWAFASTGGNGVHFSLLSAGAKIDSDSPVIVTNPPGYGESHVVGESLFDFLCFGVLRGYFALENLAYDLDLTLRAYTDPSWEPTEKDHHSVGFGVDEHKRQLLNFLAQRFELKPWTDANRFAELQKRFERKIVSPLDSKSDGHHS